jgi:hypothetical protein
MQTQTPRQEQRTLFRTPPARAIVAARRGGRGRLGAISGAARSAALGSARAARINI